MAPKRSSTPAAPTTHLGFETKHWIVFDKQVKPLSQHAPAKLQESHTLAALRDTLLPKLLSGELPTEQFQNP
ncbi:MAG: hypothetical protein KDK99_03600 [Verrucomicrobiales bacterium]|nr:hypothetical protein [Verrucomicrobiales bacterium]